MGHGDRAESRVSTFFLFSAIKEEKRTAPFSEVEVFHKGKLKHVETEVKNSLPDAQSKLNKVYFNTVVSQRDFFNKMLCCTLAFIRKLHDEISILCIHLGGYQWF